MGGLLSHPIKLGVGRSVSWWGREKMGFSVSVLFVVVKMI